MKADRAMGGVATMERPATTKGPGRPRSGDVATARDERVRLVTQSVGQPSLTRFAHENGILLPTLSSWRGMARDGDLPVPPRVRAALKAEMPGRTFQRSGKRRKVHTALTGEQASKVVLDSIRSGKSLRAVAEAHQISTAQLTQLRARARDGLIEIPMVDRALLKGHVMNRGSYIANRKPFEFNKPAAAPAAVPAKRGKTASAPASKAPARKSTSTVKPAEPLVLRKNGATIEIPTTLPAAKLAAVLAAALAA